jgi:hypothetical protein
MKALSAANLAELTKPRKRTTTASKRGQQFTQAGEWEKLDSAKIERFREKLGTPVRSRKGRTYRKGNGYVRFDSWTENEQPIAYFAK